MRLGEGNIQNIVKARYSDSSGAADHSMSTHGFDMNMGEPEQIPKSNARCKPENGKDVQLMFRQSDAPIVAKKQGNSCGAKGRTTTHRDSKDTTTGLRTGLWVRTKLESITSLVKRNPRIKFTSLAHMLSEEFLLLCFEELKRNRVPGIDGISVEMYETKKEGRIVNLVARLKTNKYKPLPVKRAFIPKADGSKRPLGIPAVEDKLVQMGIKKILEAIYEPIFSKTSFGFRPNLGCHDALNKLRVEIMFKAVESIVDMDIRKFFDTVNHDWLIKALKLKIADSRMLSLITKMLKSGVMDGGEFHETSEGTPQGGVLSPLLANVYLHYILDMWFYRDIEPNTRGYCELIRYADDFVACFANEIDAKEFGNKLKDRLAKYGLTIAEEKSRIIKFGKIAWHRSRKSKSKLQTFDFLGFTHCCAKSRKGNFCLIQQTSRKKYRLKINDIRQWLEQEVRKPREQQKEIVKKINQKLIGHYQYYGRCGNYRMLKGFYQQVEETFFKILNSRSQRRSHTWKTFRKMLKYNPLIKPKIYRKM